MPERHLSGFPSFPSIRQWMMSQKVGELVVEEIFPFHRTGSGRNLYGYVIGFIDVDERSLNFPPADFPPDQSTVIITDQLQSDLEVHVLLDGSMELQVIEMLSSQSESSESLEHLIFRKLWRSTYAAGKPLLERVEHAPAQREMPIGASGLRALLRQPAPSFSSSLERRRSSSSIITMMRSLSSSASPWLL